MSNLQQQIRQALPKGVRFSVTPPHNYTMHYLNGSQHYREPFVKMHVSGDWAKQIEFAYDSIFTAIAGAAAAVPYIGPGLMFAVQIGANWFKEANMNSDGSIDFYAAYHYIGSQNAGLDVTAWPIPGVDPKAWQFAVNGLMQGARFISSGRNNSRVLKNSYVRKAADFNQEHANEDLLIYDFDLDEEISGGDESLSIPKGVDFKESRTPEGNKPELLTGEES